MIVSIIGAGQVGQCYARALAHAGHTIHTLCDIAPTSAMRTLADELGATLTPTIGPWLAQADIVISAVFGHAALDVLAQSLPHMKAGAQFADFTTASPQDMERAADQAAAHGLAFTDVAIMGAIFIARDKTPLLCSGTGADTIAAFMSEWGAPARAIEGKAGDAMTLKLLRSIITKGLESLAVECLVAADRKNLRPALYEVLADVDSLPLTSFMGSMVRSHVVHAERRLVEVQEARQQLRDDHLQPLVLDGVERLFARTAQALAQRRQQEIDAPGSVPPLGDSLDDSLKWLTPLAQRA